MLLAGRLMLSFEKMSKQKWSPLDEFRNAQPANTFPSRRLPPPILPPLTATITQAPTILAHPLTLPRLPSMAAPLQASSASPVMQSAVPPQYFASHAQSLSMQPGSPQHSNSPTIQYSAPSGARQAKKEIKRRTKTGCLTCRARRIKCDEQRPTCRNCTKSKRECQGYDPVFRTPTSVQAAPTTMQTLGHNFNDFPSIDPTLDNSIGIRPLPGEYDPSYQGYLTAPPLSIEDVLNVGSGHPPPEIAAHSGLEPADRQTIASLFEVLYAPYIDKFLETKWFANRGLEHLLNNTFLIEKYKVLKSRFIYTPSTDMREFLVTQSLEAHIIWETMLLARQVSLSLTATNDPSSSIEIMEGVHDVAKRINAFEALITNQTLNPANMLPEPTKPGATSPTGRPALQEQLIFREQNFWYLTSRFCTLRDDAKSLDENPVEEIDKVLLDMRLLLDSRENRDIVYSIAVIRHVGHKLAARAAAQASGESTIGQPVSNNEEDPATKVSVARRFISDEANGKGTNQVTQRICGMAVMAWSKR